MSDYLDQIYDNFADNLRLIVSNRYSRRADFAAEIEVDESQLSKWLSGKRHPTLAIAYLLAQHLEVPLDQLCGDPAVVQEELGFG
jgi:transcriptional regulator with XRE-family HTH domain